MPATSRPRRTRSLPKQSIGHPPSKRTPLRYFPALLPFFSSTAIDTTVAIAGDEVTLGELCDRAVESKNALLILDAFCIARLCGASIPASLLNWLNHHFSTYLAGDGRKSLDEVMGLTAGKKGGTSPLRQMLINARDEMMMLDVFRLKCLGATTAEAAALVAARCESALWNLTTVEIREPGEDRVIDLYKRTWKRRFSGADAKNSTNEWLKDHRDNFLAEFPPDLIPQRLRKKGA